MDALDVVMELQKLLIFIIALIGSVFQAIGAKRSMHRGYSWMKWGFSIVLFYWAFYYAQSFFGRFIVFNHQVWIRTAILLTVSLITACGIMTIRRRK